MDKFSTREVIEQAVQTERLGCEFYTAMAKRFKENDKLKNLFEMLAVNEQQHEKRFSELKNKIKIKNEEVEGWEDVSQYLRAIVESEFFLGKNKSLPSLEHVKTIVDALNFALGFEKETLLYYHSLKDIIDEKDVMNDIIKEEKQHIIWLHELKRSLK